MADSLLKLTKVSRVFRQAGNDLEVFSGVSLSINPGELVALVGPSGAGKSTLLHIAGLLEKPSSGDIFFEGKSCREMSDSERTLIRRRGLGFVYQYHHLLPEFSALENIVIPQLIAGKPSKQARARAMQLLKGLGLERRASHRPGRLSGGEQQRVAIGRALANGPQLLLADEPTGNLDPDTANEVFDLLLKIVRKSKLACLIATHNPLLAARMDRTVRIQHGKLVAR